MADKPTRQATIDRKPAFEASLLKFARRDSNIMARLATFIAMKASRPPVALPRGMRDHALGGVLSGFSECHLAADACLLYTDSGGVVTLIEIVDHDEMQGPKAKAVAKRNAAFRR